MISTLKNDPESLKAILEWGYKNDLLNVKEVNTNNNIEGKETNCPPILVASLQNYTQCMNELYRYGYRILLPDEDKKIIEEVLNMKDSLGSNIQFYFALHPMFPFPFHEHKGSKEEKDSLMINPDPVERFLRFKATANPEYLSIEFIDNGEKLKNKEDELRLLDPIRKSFALAQYSKQLSSHYGLHSDEYKDISDKCHKFAEEILDQCENAKKVRTILEYSPNFEDDERSENTNWQLALWEKQMDFVGNPYYQNFLWEKITGKNFNWDKYSLLWRIVYCPLAIVVFCFVPLIVLMDSLFRNSDILFVSQEMMEKEPKNKNK